MIHALPQIGDFPHHRTAPSPAATTRLAGRCAALLRGGEVILLWGDLGAGKTFFVQGLCKALDVEAEVVSPTFTLVNSYPGRIRVHHLDFYRLKAEDDLVEVGVEAILDDVESGAAVLLAEWPGPLLPWLRDRIELMSTAGETVDARIWHLRGSPGMSPAWRDLFESGSDDA